MKKTTHIIDDMEVEIVLETPTEIVASPIEGNEGERLFAQSAQIQEKPTKNQAKTNKKPVSDQGKTNEKPVGDTQKTTLKNSIELAREKRPEPMHLLDEIQQKWFLIDALQANVYPTEYANGFVDLYTQMKKGEISGCPRPIAKSVNRTLHSKVSRDQITRTLKLYIRYTDEYRETRVWMFLFRGFDRMDSLLTRLLDF